MSPQAILAIATLFVAAQTAPSAGPKYTLDDLKKLEITCFVPAYLPKGFHLTKVDVTQEEDPSGETQRKFPLYNIEYKGAGKASFWVDSAREGIGDRNIMDIDDTEETELHSPIFGPVYIIYTPAGKTGVKKEITANWIRDAQMVAETGTDPLAHPVLGRFHGFSATGITVAEFGKIIDSLQPVRPMDSGSSAEKAGQNQIEDSGRAAAAKLHPKIFSMIESWISDGESPVVTEINLDAVEKDRNQFDPDTLRQEDGWTRCPGAEPNSFMRYRLVESHGNRYKAEYQENGGGSLTTASMIDFTIEKRDIERDGHPAPITVLRVSSCRPLH
jgi:hypothetical protein